MVDVQGPVVAEAALLGPPLQSVAGRLAQLLDEWPGHPILSQLQAICGRLLGGCPHLRALLPRPTRATPPRPLCAALR